MRRQGGMWRQGMWRQNVASGGNVTSGNVASQHQGMWRQNAASASGRKVLHRLPPPCLLSLIPMQTKFIYNLRKKSPNESVLGEMHCLAILQPLTWAPVVRYGVMVRGRRCNWVEICHNFKCPLHLLHQALVET